MNVSFVWADGREDTMDIEPEYAMRPIIYRAQPYGERVMFNRQERIDGLIYYFQNAQATFWYADGTKETQQIDPAWMHSAYVYKKTLSGGSIMFKRTVDGAQIVYVELQRAENL